MSGATHSSGPPNPAERLAALIDALCKAVAAHGVRGMLAAPLLLLLWSQLRRMGARAQRLAGRIASNAPPATPHPQRPRRARSRPSPRLPRGVAWLVRAVPGTAAGASQLPVLLTDPQMATLAQTPPMRRLLNPLCRMLGVPPPPASPAPGPLPARNAIGAADPPPRPPPPDRLRTPPPDRLRTPPPSGGRPAPSCSLARPGSG